MSAVCGELAEVVESVRSALREDFERNPTLSQRITLVVWRAGGALKGRKHPVALVLRVVQLVANAIWMRGVMGAEIPTSVPIGPGLWLPHSARGIVMHHTTRIGSGCTIYHQCTMGVKRDSGNGPTLGNNVFVGAGAKIIGDITISDGTTIGANAVVVHDTEPGSTYVGVPARRVDNKQPTS